MISKNEVIDFLASDQVATDEFIETMYANIGIAEDSNYRDEVIFEGWYTLIENDRISLDQKKYLLHTALAERILFKGIGNGVSDDSFTRSFTSLMFRALLKDHNQTPWISSDKLLELSHQVDEYIQNEIDTRGLVEGKGWCHTFAHVADLMVELVRSEVSKVGMVDHYLSAIKRSNVKIDEFIYGEEARLNQVIIQLIQSDLLNEDQLATWLDEIQQNILENQVFNLTYVRAVESLYFQMKGEDIQFQNVFQSIDQFLISFYKIQGIV